MWRRLAAGGAASAVALAIALAALASPAAAATLPTPTDVTATAYPTEANVSFDAVSPPSGVFYTYTATVSPGGATWDIGTDGPAPTSIQVYNLTNGALYTFTVAVSDANGDSSAPSAPSNQVTPEPIAPEAPGDVTATAGDGQATVSFAGDGDSADGGSAISAYTVTAAPGGVKASGSSSPITVTGLDDGTQYTFTVTATNEAGTSPPSTSSAPVTPLAVPSATTDPAITGAAQVDETVTASQGAWDGDPSNLDYQWYDCDPSDATNCTAIPDATSADYRVAPLDGGSTLEVTVTATNSDAEVGTATSAPTATVTAQPNAPEPVTSPAIGTVDGAQAVTGTAGTWTNNPTSYTYEWYSCLPDLSACAVDAGPTTTAATVSVYTPTGDDGGDVLLLEVIATNATGDSVAALSPVAGPVVFPPPTISMSVPTNGGVYISGGMGPPNFTCTPGEGAQLVECAGSSLEFPTAAGRYTYTVTAEDDDGQTATQTVSYTVIASIAPVTFVPIPPPPLSRPTFTQLPGPSASTAPALVVSGLGETNSRWRAGKAATKNSPGSWVVVDASAAPVGTRFSFTASEDALVTFAFSRQESGRKQGGRCVAPSHKNRRGKACRRSVAVGSLVVSGVGADTISFDGKLSGRLLPPGGYAATVTAEPNSTSSGAAGIVSAGTLHFTIVS